MIRAEIIAIGDELTSGQRVDTNSAWLSKQLEDLGIHVIYHTTCADDLDACTSVFARALERVELIVSTGGLGPTADDLTRDAIAGAIGQPLELREEILEQIEQLFRRRGRDMPPNNRVQAMFPVGAHVIPNPHGTAPGIFWSSKLKDSMSTRALFAVPGVPVEMREMWQGTVEPEIRSLFPPQKRIRHFRLKCFGTGESHLEQMLPDLIRRGRTPTVGITVHRATITLRITAEADSDDACWLAMQPTIATIRDCLGDLVFGEEDDELQHAVTRLLLDQKATVATVEWGTPGLVMQWLKVAGEEVTAAAAGKSPFSGGLLVSSHTQLERALGVPPDEVKVAPATYWKQIARAARELFDADYGLVIGDFAAGAADPQFWMALATRHGEQSQSRDLAGHPDIVADRSGKQLLDWLRKTLLSPRRDACSV